MATKTSSRTLLLIPLLIGSILAVISFVPGWQQADNGMYDLFLRMKPPIEENSSLVLLNVDDEAVMRAGTWPWPRQVVAQGIEALTELGAAYTVFDIEYLEKSPMSVDVPYLDVSLKDQFLRDFKEINDSVRELFGALKNKSIGFADLSDYADALSLRIREIENELYLNARRVAIENDSYLGKSFRLFDSAFLTLNLQPELVTETPETLRTMARDKFHYPSVDTKSQIPASSKDFLIPISEISSMAKGAGFTNVIIDDDGSRRRVVLVTEIEGKVYAQLALRPLLDKLGNPELLLKNGQLTLKAAKIDGKTKDIHIPVDAKGRMLIHWPSAKFSKSFEPHLSFYRLIEYRDAERELATHISAMEGNEIWSLTNDKNPMQTLLKLWNDCEASRLAGLEDGSALSRERFIAAKNVYYAALTALLTSTYAKDAVTYLQEARDSDVPENYNLYTDFETSFLKAWNNIEELVRNLLETRESLSSRLKGATCLIGWTSTASTDFGVNPFDNKFANVGTHAALSNTILQGKFLSLAPEWVSPLLALLLAVGLIALVRTAGTGAQIAIGIGATISLFFVLFGIFVFTGIYIAALAPIAAVFLSFLVYILAVFFLTEQEKSFLRKAFSTYLSADVIAEMVQDPGKLRLGGQKKWISAMFTDVRGFSTISEKLEPEQLVRLLNLYLSGMSDIILENRGTIDKFEGDAIISFFGAPIDYSTHAEAICRSAILMKRKENELNIRFQAENLSPVPLMTRIGINTGHMVVGNMGTEKKMDYTIMGNAVNLAARLEGVNKQYGSWILATETTKAEAGLAFLWRRLDRVRVVGIFQPLRLYELVDFDQDASNETKVLLKEFDAALDLFEEHNWQEAYNAFAQLSSTYPEDGPSKIYEKRSKEFLEKPPSQDWDGVFNLTEK